MTLLYVREAQYLAPLNLANRLYIAAAYTVTQISQGLEAVTCPAQTARQAR